MLVRTSRASGSIVAAMLSRRMAWMVALVATFTMTVSYVDRQTLAVLAPDVTKALGIDNESYGWLQSAFSIAWARGGGWSRRCSRGRWSRRSMR